MRVVLDTNVFLSAVLFGGKPQQVLDAAFSGRVRIFVSEALVAELDGVLRRPKFGLTTQFIQAIISEMTSLAEWVAPRRHVQVVDDDPTDNQVIDCAIEAGAHYIVSGDAHLLRLAKFENTPILDVDGFLRLMEEHST